MLKILTFLSIYLCLVTGQQNENNDLENNNLSNANKRPLLKNLQGQNVQKNYNDEENYYNTLSNTNESPYLTNVQSKQKEYSDVENNYNDLSNIKSKTLLKYLQDQKKEYNGAENNYNSLSDVNERTVVDNEQDEQTEYNGMKNDHNSLSNTNKNRYLNRGPQLSDQNLQGQQKEYNNLANNYNSLSNANEKTLQGQQKENNNVEKSYNSLSNFNKNRYLSQGAQLPVQNLQGQQKEYDDVDDNYSLANANKISLSNIFHDQQKKYNDVENNYTSINQGLKLLARALQGQQKGYNDVENYLSNVDQNRYLDRRPQLSVQNLQGQQKQYDDVENNYNLLSNANKNVLSKNLQGQQKVYNDVGNNYDSLSNANERLSLNPRPQFSIQNTQGNYAREQILRKKPCPKRRSQSGNIPTAENWVPTYHWKYERPLANSNNNLNTERNTLQSQSLKSKEDGNSNNEIYEVNTKKLLNCLNKSKQKTSDSEKNSNILEDYEESQVLRNENFADGSGANLIKSVSDNNSNDKSDCLDKDDSYSGNSLSSSSDIVLPSDDNLLSSSARLSSKDRLLISPYNNLISEDNSLSSSYDDWLSSKVTNSKGSISGDASLYEYSTLAKNKNSLSPLDDGLSPSDSSSPSDAANSRRLISDDKSLYAVNEIMHLKPTRGQSKNVLSKPLLTDNYYASTQNNNLQTKDSRVQKKYYQDDDLTNNGLEANTYQAQKNENQQDLDSRKPPSEIEGQLMEPTKGRGLSDVSVSRVMLMQHSRVCYACSSATDQSCLNPNRRTTVKYCRKGHDVCVTKTYKSYESGLIVIRDCAETCDTRIPALEKIYSSCAICRNDLCNSGYVFNGSYSINNYNMIIVLFVTCLVKYL